LRLRSRGGTPPELAGEDARATISPGDDGGGVKLAMLHCLPASVALDIASKPFAFYGIHMKHTVEPGELEIMAGNSSRGTDLQKAIPTMTK